jgi:hypothetical protein
MTANSFRCETAEGQQTAAKAAANKQQYTLCCWGAVDSQRTAAGQQADARLKQL